MASTLWQVQYGQVRHKVYMHNCKSKSLQSTCSGYAYCQELDCAPNLIACAGVCNCVYGYLSYMQVYQ